MATRAVALAQGTDGTLTATWTGLTNATTDDGQKTGGWPYRWKSVQVKGTFGAGGTVVMEGSMDGGTTWGSLKNISDADISITDSKIYNIGTGALLIRPRVSGGDGTTNLTCIMAGVR